jgi:hypothetical protein
MMHSFTRNHFFLLLITWLLCPLFVRAQSWQSAFVIPTLGNGSTIQKVVADGAGGYVVAGDYSGTITLGSFTLTSGADGDIFIGRLDAAGTWTQAVNSGGVGDKSIKALALDANSNVVIAGEFKRATTTFGAITLANSSTNTAQDTDIFLARLNTAGQWTQAVRAGGPNQDAVNGLALGANGTATLVGSFTGGTITFGTRTINGSSSGALFVARLNTLGTWTQAVGAGNGGAPNYAYDVALDASGNAVICGFYFGGGVITFGTISLSTSATATAFVARLNTAGTWTQAVQAVNPNGFAAASHVAVDAANNIVISGNYRNESISFGTYTLPYVPSSDNLFVARLSSAGVWTQAAQASGSGSTFPEGLSLAADGSAWVTGQFRSPVANFGNLSVANTSTAPDPVNQLLTTDIFVARLSAAGNWVYATKAGGLNADYPTSVLVNGSEVLVTGALGAGSGSFGTLATTATGTYTTGFLARIGNGILGTAPAKTATSLSLAPNPATAFVVLTLPSATIPRLAQVLNPLGKEVHQQLVPAQSTSVKLTVAGLIPGVYLVRCGEHSERLLIE